MNACTSIRAYHGNTFTLPPLGKISSYGRSDADCVDELIFKVVNAPIKRMKTETYLLEKKAEG